MNKYMAVIEYDGTGFNGFQAQPEGTRTVQQELTEALSGILNSPITIGYAGRTDAGVHAKGQVIDFNTEKELDLYRFKWSLNGVLPGDIAVSRIEKAEPSFDPRRDARLREYIYRVVNADYHSVFLRRYSILVNRELKLEVMKKTAGLFAGEHDFAPFASPSVSLEYTVRKIFRFDIKAGDGGLLEFTVQANSFLYNMVRIMTGIILEAGRGEMDMSRVKKALKTGGENFSSSMAPAKGLTLNKVEY
jgi:tRNA pseudouridine38-40 synthase